MEKEKDDNKFTNKKFKNPVDEQSQQDLVDNDYKMYYDQKNTHLLKMDEDDEEDLNKIVNVDFLFSEIRNTYFFGVKHFLEGMLDFDEFDSSGLADLILEEREFLGTVIKTELEEDSGNELPDLYALATLIPYDYFPSIKSLNQYMGYCFKKIESNISTGITLNDNKDFKDFIELFAKKAELLISKDTINFSSNKLLEEKFNIIKKSKLGIFINERVSNLPQALVGPLLNLLKQDIINFKEANNGEEGEDKYDFTHILYITK